MKSYIFVYLGQLEVSLQLELGMELQGACPSFIDAFMRSAPDTDTREP
jgi:hypothetical protein